MRACRKNRSIYVKIKPDPAVRPLYHGAAAEIHGVAHYHDDLHVDLHDCRRLLCLELRGQNGVHGAEPHLPLYPDAGLPRLYDRHGRQCAGRHDAGHGR